MLAFSQQKGLISRPHNLGSLHTKSQLETSSTSSAMYLSYQIIILGRSWLSNALEETPWYLNSAFIYCTTTEVILPILGTTQTVSKIRKALTGDTGHDVYLIGTLTTSWVCWRPWPKPPQYVNQADASRSTTNTSQPYSSPNASFYAEDCRSPNICSARLNAAT